MVEWAPKRFWDAAGVTPADGGFGVALDGRAVRTPARAPLVLPTEGLARAIAAEWDVQGERIDPETMPHTRMANTAIDRVGANRIEIEEFLAGYGATDLTCYRADTPAGLVARQAEVWDPLLNWAEEAFGARLRVTAGLIPVQQPAQALDNLTRPLRRFGDFELAALHDLVTLTGSLVIGLAAARNESDAAGLFDAAYVDEDWQIAQWGEDSEAAKARSTRRADYESAARFLFLAQKTGG